MSDKNRDLLERLTKAGFWKKTDAGDPLTEDKALGLVLERVEERFARGTFLFVNGPRLSQGEYELRVVWLGGRSQLASGRTLAEAILNAAFALPGFLKEHPECARPEIYDSPPPNEEPSPPKLEVPADTAEINEFPVWL